MKFPITFPLHRQYDDGGVFDSNNEDFSGGQLVCDCHEADHAAEIVRRANLHDELVTALAECAAKLALLGLPRQPGDCIDRANAMFAKATAK